MSHACACCGQGVDDPAYVGRDGIYCQRACISRGPVRLLLEAQAVAAELRRRKVRFLPKQATRRIKATVIHRDEDGYEIRKESRNYGRN